MKIIEDLIIQTINETIVIIDAEENQKHEVGLYLKIIDVLNYIKWKSKLGIFQKTHKKLIEINNKHYISLIKH